jgi:hypothetical protein
MSRLQCYGITVLAILLSCLVGDVTITVFGSGIYWSAFALLVHWYNTEKAVFKPEAK